MSERGVNRAIDRWQEAGLLDAETAERLRSDHARSSDRVQRRFSQYAVALTAGVLLVVAAVTFLAWSWPRMDDGWRSVLIWGIGIGVLALGLRLEGRGSGGAPVRYALKMSGLALMLGAYAYSEQAWPPGSAAGIAVGALSLATPIAALLTFGRRTPVMLASVIAVGYAFVAVFLHRALALPDTALVWALDGVLVATMAWLAFRLWESTRTAASADAADGSVGAANGSPAAAAADAAAVDGGAGPSGAPHRYALYPFVASVYAGFFFVLLTAAVALELEDDIALALDAWLVIATVIALWAVHRAPPPIASPRHVHHVAMSVAIAIPLGFATTLGSYDAPPPVAAFTVAGIGAAGLWYGLNRRAASLIVTSCAAIVIGGWYLGVEYGDRLGAVAALGALALGFFLVASRVGLGRTADAEYGGQGSDGVS